MITRFFAVALSLSLGCSALQAQQSTAHEPAKKAQNSKLDLTPRSFTDFHNLIRPHENEWRHLRVNWLTDVVAARTQAAEEDKPLVICYTGGAGYNEPLGVC